MVVDEVDAVVDLISEAVVKAVVDRFAEVVAVPLSQFG